MNDMILSDLEDLRDSMETENSRLAILIAIAQVKETVARIELQGLLPLLAREAS
jgi:hypothetical protein